MPKPYSQKHILTQPLGNNAFAWKEREVLCGHSPTLTIPSLIDGTLDDVILGEDVVFEELEDGQIRSCRGLENFVRIIRSDEISKSGVRGEGTVGTKIIVIGKDEQSEEEGAGLPLETFGTFGYKSTENGVGKIPEENQNLDSRLRENDRNTGLLRTSRGQISQEIIIFDNHNHALYFWLDAVRRGVLETGFELIHIDEHSDLWDNLHELDVSRAVEEELYAWEFTNLDCNVGNYIQPALRSGLVGSMIRIENEYQIDTYMDYTPMDNSVLNLDIDIFAPELDHIPEEKKIHIIQNLLKKVKYVTLATSPFFIDQGKAIEKIQKIFSDQG